MNTSLSPPDSIGVRGDRAYPCPVEAKKDNHASIADPPRSRRAAPWNILALFLGISLAVVAVAYAFKMVAITPFSSFTDRVALALGKVTQSDVKITSNTITVEQSDIAELAVISRKIQTIVKYESEVLGSNNILILKGHFTVKAGFDLALPFSVEVDSNNNTVITNFPPPKLISVEMDDYEVFHSQDGFWNKLKPSDQELVTRQLITQARIDAEKSDIKAEAERRLKTRLEDLLSSPGKAPVIAAPLP